MRVPDSRPVGAMRQLVRLNTSAYDLERPSDTKGDMGERIDSTTTVTGVNLWLFDPEQNTLQTEFGDRLQGDLQGLALPNADVQHDDQVTHGGAAYEVNRIAHVPDNSDQQVKLLSLLKRTNT